MAKFVTRKQNLTKTTFTNNGLTDQTATSRIGAALSAVTTDKGHVIIGLNVANIHTAAITVDIALVAADHSKIYLCKSTTIPVGGNLDLVDGKIVITDTTEIHGIVSGTTHADVVLSVLENA